MSEGMEQNGGLGIGGGVDVGGARGGTSWDRRFRAWLRSALSHASVARIGC